MAEMKVHVDQSELDDAIAKAERLIGMLEDIEQRLAVIESRQDGVTVDIPDMAKMTADMGMRLVREIQKR